MQRVNPEAEIVRGFFRFIRNFRRPGRINPEARRLALQPENLFPFRKLFRQRGQPFPVNRNIRFRKNVQIRREQFFEYGKNIRFYKGVDTWFDRINRYGKSKGVDVQHYIISSGLKEMIEGTKIARYFNRIFASCYMYDGEGNPIWPARAVNYTNKTQYIFRLNKGVLDERDDDSVNAYTPHKNRVLPFSQIVYIGDGATDIPCMRLVKNFGGFAIMIYQDEMPEKKQMAQKYLETGRISMISPNDYSPGSNLERGVKLIIDSVVAKARFNEINSLEFD